MTWFAFPGGWGDYNLNGVAEKTLASLGAHGYATQAQADKNVNASPDPLQAAYLQTLKGVSVSPIGAGLGGDLSTPNATGGVSGAASNVLGDLAYSLSLSGNNAAGQPVHLLTRFLKILFGGALLLAGILKLTGKQDIIVGAGKKVIEGAMLA